ncbi:MAG: hypothetical protein IJK61_06810 [Bacteroidetes bacterium]|nr:hypothetical protein [Bacteroidota bacterium]
MKAYTRYIFFLVIFIFSISSTKAQPISVCDEYIDTAYCSNWGEWHTAIEWFDIPSAPRNQWVSSINCPIQVLYKWRQCKDDPILVQYQILSYVIDFSYKVWIDSKGWIYPCREALDLFKGSADEVAIRNNEILDNIFKKILVSGFDYFRKDLDIPYALCNPDPNDLNTRPVPAIMRNGACQGMCRIQRPADAITLDEYDNITSIAHPPVEAFANWYGVDTNDIKIEELNSTDLSELNTYIQTEINSGIIEQEYKLQPIMTERDAIIIITPIDCTPDYCNIYELTLCVDDNGNTNLTERRTGITSGECSGYPNKSSCPEGTFQVTYPCTFTGDN